MKKRVVECYVWYALSLFLKEVNVKQVLKNICYLWGTGLGGIFTILVFFLLRFLYYASCYLFHNQKKTFSEKL